MSARTRKASALIRLKAQMEENNDKSPDVTSAIVTVSTRSEAYATARIFEEVSCEDLPFELDEWQRTIAKLPVELYFVFKRKRDLIRFLKEVRKELPPKTKIIF